MRRLLMSSLLIATACTPAAPPKTAAAPPPYRALGTEPFWSVTLSNGRMSYEEAGQQQIDVAAPSTQPGRNGARYVTDRLTLEIVHRQCSDGMSDRSYPDTTRVIADGRELKGCGAPMTNDPLTGKDWRINAIDGAKTVGERPATLNFADGRVTGTAGCNRLTGSYSIDGDRIAFAPVATTRMACPEPLMRQESRILAILRDPVTLVHGKDGVMLEGASGGSITLIPVRR